MFIITLGGGTEKLFIGVVVFLFTNFGMYLIINGKYKPDYAYAFNNRGTVYFALGDKQKALADFEKAYELDPNYKLAADNIALTKNSMK